MACGDRIFRKVIGAIHEMAGRGDGERPERIDVGDIVKQFAKLHTTPSEKINVGTTVREDFFFKIKNVIAIAHSLMPHHKRFFIFGIHFVWIVIRCRWNGTDILISYSARYAWNCLAWSISRILVKLLCQTRLRRLSVIPYLTVARIVIELGFGGHKSSRHT